jgi:hypothetical protein
MARLTSKSPTLDERLLDEKKRIEGEAGRIEPGSARNKLLDKLRQLDVAAHMNEWLASPGLQAPR